MTTIDETQLGWTTDQIITTLPDGYDANFTIAVRHHNAAPDQHAVVIGGNEDSDPDEYGDTWIFAPSTARILAQALIAAANHAEDLNSHRPQPACQVVQFPRWTP